ncbi:hypothetical protein TNCV_673101 [Trichonephila clavipes]|uniref:CCHC-type domain-containing protein n=1 Tax=Trichonephila clavipes TaxID=2585209 RepID=A0A8X6WCY4_TRICX|nr:hypothetical protein TNCV_673101 [Trichonephila clavipes]
MGASRFNGLYGRQGCILTRTVESNQGGRLDGNESAADSFRCGAGVSKSVQEFAARIKKLGTQIFQSGNSVRTIAARNAIDQLLQSRFISGLRNDIRRFVLARDPNTLEESINAALIEEQNFKLNEIASNEHSGLSAQAKESAIISALTDKLQELNLRVERLQETNTINARETTKGEFRRNMGVFKCFYCGIEGHRQIECRKRLANQRSLDSPGFRRPIRGRSQVPVPRAFNLSINDVLAFPIRPLTITIQPLALCKVVIHMFHKAIAMKGLSTFKEVRMQAL